MGIRAEHRAQMLGDIQSATLDLVEENGLDATTIGHIAARVGVTERTFFRYYPSKEHALLPGLQDLIDVLVVLEARRTDPAGILADLLAECRQLFAAEVERNYFRRISRLFAKDPDMTRVVARYERDLAQALSSALIQQGAMGAIQALLVAEVVTATWRIAWQALALGEGAGVDADPVSLFDDTVRELGNLFPGRG